VQRKKKRKKEAKNRKLEELWRLNLNTVYATVATVLALGMIIWGVFGGAFLPYG